MPPVLHNANKKDILKIVRGAPQYRAYPFILLTIFFVKMNFAAFGAPFFRMSSEEENANNESDDEHGLCASVSVLKKFIVAATLRIMVVMLQN